MDDQPNADEKEYWSGPSGLGWIDFEETLDTLFQPVTDAILRSAGLAAGERVLDIGCGTGAHSLTAARIVGNGGRVMATDISEPLLNRTQERAEALDLTVETEIADGQTYGFEAGAFDLVTSRFGVMFFADPAMAFSNIAGAVRSGGKMVFGVWAPVRDNPWWYLPSTAAKGVLGDVPRSEPNAPGPMGLADVDYVASIFREADIGSFDIEPIDVLMTHPGGVDVVTHMAMNVGSAARALRLYEADEGQRKAVGADLLMALREFDSEDGFGIPAKINLIRVDVS